MNFVILGELSLPAGKRTFSKEVEAPSENAARNKVYALFGSDNGLTRNKIKIASIAKA